MINLVSGSNTVYLTLTEKATLATPKYVLLFKNDDTREAFACALTELSADPIFVNKFTVTVQASPNWLLGQVVLSNVGFYSYWAFECSDPTTINYSNLIAAAVDVDALVPTYFTSEVESGKMLYVGTAQTINSFADTTAPIKAYGN